MAKPIFSPFWRQCFVTSGVCGNIIGLGCALGYPAVLLPQLGAPGALVPISKDAASWFASAMAMPTLVGNFLSPPLMGRRGRRVAHFAVTLPMLMGWFCIILATNFEMLLIGRMLHGLAYGMFMPLRSVLIGEYTSPENRGAFLTMVSLSQCFGIFFAHLVGSLLSWQKTALICVFFSFTSLLITIYSPESPSYLATKGRYDDCAQVFKWLRGEDGEKELDEMIQAQKSSRSEVRLSYKDVLVIIKKKEFYKPIIIMVHAYALIEFSGGTTMASYSTVIIRLILGPTASAAFWMVILDGQRIISNCLAVYVINRTGRRLILFTIGAISVITHIVIAAYVCAKNQGMFQYHAIWIPVILINVHFFTVATAMVPLPLVIAGEIFPLEYRSVAGSISVVSAATVSFIVLKTFPSLLASIKLEGTYLLYAGLLTYLLAVIFFMLPETRGKTLQQIEEEFRGSSKTQEEIGLTKSLKDNEKSSEVAKA